MRTTVFSRLEYYDVNASHLFSVSGSLLVIAPQQQSKRKFGFQASSSRAAAEREALLGDPYRISSPHTYTYHNATYLARTSTQHSRHKLFELLKKRV